MPELALITAQLPLIRMANDNENADRHLIAYALRWRPFYTPGDLTVTEERYEAGGNRRASGQCY